MRADKRRASTLPTPDSLPTPPPQTEPALAPTGQPWPDLPTETEITIRADGQVVIADLPAELAGLATALGIPVACEISPMKV